MGRRSPMAGWLGEVTETPVQQESEDSGFLYYTRVYRILALAETHEAVAPPGPSRDQLLALLS